MTSEPPPPSAANPFYPPRHFSLRRRLLDRLALRPSRQPLDPGPQLRHWIEGSGLRLECFRQFQLGNAPGQSLLTKDGVAERPSVNLLSPSDLAVGQYPPPQRVIVKFAGNAGRAERSTLHPAEAWADQNVEIWTINPPGYGQSPGRASLDHVPSMAAAVWRTIARHYGNVSDLPVVILGNSIGALAALHTVLADQSLAPEPSVGPRVAGLLLRNPPDLVPLILQHRRRWFHGPVPAWLVRAWGPEFDSPRLIAGCHCPLLLLQSEWDREVPPSNQDRLWDAHPGPKLKFIVPGADHEQLPTPSQPDLYRRYLEAIRSHL